MKLSSAQTHHFRGVTIGDLGVRKLDIAACNWLAFCASSSCILLNSISCTLSLSFKVSVSVSKASISLRCLRVWSVRRYKDIVTRVTRIHKNVTFTHQDFTASSITDLPIMHVQFESEELFKQQYTRDKTYVLTSFLWPYLRVVFPMLNTYLWSLLILVTDVVIYSIVCCVVFLLCSLLLPTHCFCQLLPVNKYYIHMTIFKGVSWIQQLLFKSLHTL